VCVVALCFKNSAFSAPLRLKWIPASAGMTTPAHPSPRRRPGSTGDFALRSQDVAVRLAPSRFKCPLRACGPESPRHEDAKLLAHPVSVLLNFFKGSCFRRNDRENIVAIPCPLYFNTPKAQTAPGKSAPQGDCQGRTAKSAKSPGTRGYPPSPHRGFPYNPPRR
jgi:hypothetical protein